MEQLVKEAQSLAEQGVKELILVAQETTVMERIFTERNPFMCF